MLCQQGSESPVSKDLNDFIDSCELLDDSLIDQTIIYDGELVMEVQPHTDHSYSFPEACNEITILSDEGIDDFFGNLSVPIQDSIIGSTNNEEIVLKDITEVILKDCTRRSRSSPTRSEVSFGCIAATSHIDTLVQHRVQPAQVLSEVVHAVHRTFI